ncbi:hypothetical protein DDI_2881 [Dickeya dianthicola RNS04.9]|nr:hypothetical protein DDI_2881 [Dickeya dianthicola RNS04.9]
MPFSIFFSYEKLTCIEKLTFSGPPTAVIARRGDKLRAI